MAKNMKYKGYYINRKNFHALKRSIAMLQFVFSKAKGRISKRVLQENKTHQIFRKTNFSYVCFSENFEVLCFLVKPALRFALLPYCQRNSNIKYIF